MTTAKPSLVEQLWFEADVAAEVRASHEQIASLWDHISALQREVGGHIAAPRRIRNGYSNRSAQCIGADANCGAKHEQCPGSYNHARCTCWCH